MKQALSILFLIPLISGPPAPRGIAAERFGTSAGPEVGRYGGRLVIGVRSEPRTLNPLAATDGPSREVIAPMTADLIHVNRFTHNTEPALAARWSVSKDAREYTVTLRSGVRFSDGHPFDADDVLFTFRVLLDEKIHAPQRDLLIVGGKPIEVEKIGSDTLRFSLAQPYAAAERLFDSIAMLPQHLLESAYENGTLARAWTPGTPPASIAGLGPFRLKAYAPGQQVVLERNPYYWKTDAAGQRLPYLDQLVFLIAGTEDAQVIRFQGGDTHVIQRLGADNFAVLSRTARQAGHVLTNLGPGLEYNFLFFNLNDLSSKSLPVAAARQSWFQDTRFRRAISLAIDRQAIVRLAYQGRAVPLWGHVTEGNKRWINRNLGHPDRSPEKARELLRAAGFSWRDGQLFD
ncbi:MAG: hypothetical protein HY654_08000, partial [Acidobacteria bacterium]|nr:hypothetical protein [Acidobacteriota bacterium]